VAPSMRDDKGSNLMTASPVFPVDPNQNPITNYMPCKIYDGNNGGVAAKVVSQSPTSPIGNGEQLLETMSTVLVSNPVTNQWEYWRTPGKYGYAACTTVAATDVYAPTAGKKFRLLRCIIYPAGAMAAAGVETISLQEETLGNFLTLHVWLPLTTPVTQPPIVVDLTPNGYLSTTVTKKFQIVLGTAVTAGSISVTFIGTEE
jgi:hypothetical protein